MDYEIFSKKHRVGFIIYEENSLLNYKLTFKL